MHENARRFDVDALLSIARLSSPRLSSKGDIAFSAVIPDLGANKNRPEIRVVWREGGESYYQGEGDSMPSWSPDASKLAFASRRGSGKGEKGSGLYIVGRGGEPRRVAWFTHGVSELGWASATKVYVVAPVADEKTRDKDGDYVATDRLPLWFDGSGLVAGLADQIHLVDAESGRTSRLTSEDLGVLTAEPCGNSIYYVTLRRWVDPLDTVVKSVPISGGEPETVLEGLTVSQLRCINGRLFMLAHKREIGLASHSKLYLLEDRGKTSCLTCGILDRNIWSIAGGFGGEPVIVYADRGRSVIAAVEGRVEDLVRGDMIVVQADSNGEEVVYIASSPTEPPEVYRFKGGDVERVSSINRWVVEEFRLYKPRRVEVEAEGEVVEGWYIEPEGEESKPLILFIHGGPKGMYGYGFYGEMQLFASEGFTVAYANPRGSDGYEEEFADIRGRYGDTDYKQLMKFLDAVVESSRVDEGKMAVTGISYGGYMTNVIVTKTSRFRAAVSENGIADWIADFWAADIGYWFDPDQIGGTPLDNLEEYVKRSPAFHAKNVNTPVMIIHSVEDYRCFIDQALAMHTALKVNGKESFLVVFTKGSHGHSILASPRHRRKRLELKLKWIKERLGLASTSDKGEAGVGGKNHRL
ncbi:alpha/beta hydrolase family protein [Aeropyrum camini]|uniref:Acylamino-acid-releasing enzyme n=1 Tax=Aeropyrum camini SY1 = JCM 12091 TaxID=1198449 RepID=U3TFY1_9CREN|nr:S9 family peptidase [Aeropyrum camini]BAN90903.1 acylamino-acid-releasing enzyme [Aeropyrum camini SY1 = JCM 12091]